MREDTKEDKHEAGVDEAIDDLLQGSVVGSTMEIAVSKESGRRSHSGRKVLLGVGITALVLVFSLLSFLSSAPAEFQENTYLSIEKGMTLQAIAELLNERKLIRSPFLFKMWSIAFGREGVKAGDYSLQEPVSVLALSWRLTHGDYRLQPIRVTIPEGSTNAQIATILKKEHPRFYEKKFIALAAKKEGYLFPDTYLFLPTASEEEIVKKLESTFSEKITSLQSEITHFGKPLHDIITMASLIEEEARTTESRQKIAGILWKRISAGMALQVDAVFPYILGKNTFEITFDDLKFDSPYNTYRYAGLPPGAITNPGLDAIRATVTPVTTAYWYYLSDKEGNMHYAVTHDEHLANRERYLRK